MGSQPSTATSTSSTELPQYAQDAQKNVITTGQNLTSPFLQTPAYSIAGQNADQQAAQSGYRDLLTEAQNYRGPTGQASFNAAGPAASSNVAFNPYGGTTAAQAALTQTGPASQAGLTNAGPATQANFSAGNAAQLGTGEINQFMDPYIQASLNPQLANLRSQYDKSLSDTGAKMAAAGAYGGSREAIAKGQLNKNYMDQVNQTVSSAMNQGWQNAANLAGQNAQMRQQTGMQNTSLLNNMALANAGAQNQVNLANAGAANNLAQFNAGAQNQFGLANANAANNMSQYNTGAQNTLNQANTQLSNNMALQQALQNASASNNINLQNASMANSTANNNASREMQSYGDSYNRLMASVNALQNSGDKQQQFAQSAVDTPFTMFQRLIAGTPSLNNTGSNTTTTQPLQDNTLSTLLGGGLTIAKLFGLSEDDEKTNKQKIGEDPKTGVPLYAYDYKSDVAAAKKSGKPMGPKRVGPMASDMQKLDPSSVKKVGGKRIVAQSLMDQIMQGGNA